MNESYTSTTKAFTGSVSLAAIGLKLKELKVFEPIEQQVQIARRRSKIGRPDKLYRCVDQPAGRSPWAGGDQYAPQSHTALQRAFGRSRCAEQSVVQDTLNACTPRM